MILTDDERESFGILFDAIYKQHDGAKELSFMVLECLHVWDDLWDGDSVNRCDGNQAFLNAMIKIPSHPLSRSIPHLPYMIQSIYLQWQTANEFESNGECPDKSFMLRAAVYQFFIDLSSYLFGIEHAQSISAMTWKWYAETKNEIAQEFKTCPHHFSQ